MRDLEPNVKILPEGLARIIIMICLAPVIIYFELYFLAFFLLYLMVTAMSGYDPVKHLISKVWARLKKPISP